MTYLHPGNIFGIFFLPFIQHRVRRISQSLNDHSWRARSIQQNQCGCNLFFCISHSLLQGHQKVSRFLSATPYDITVKLREGDNIIRFVPDKEGTVPYTCWMGMIRSSILVTEGA